MGRVFKCCALEWRVSATLPWDGTVLETIHRYMRGIPSHTNETVIHKNCSASNYENFSNEILNILIFTKI